MRRSNSAEAVSYVDPSTMSFVGLESSSGSSQKQQLWDWQTATQTPDTATASHHPSSFLTNNINPFLDCSTTSLLPTSDYPFYSVMEEYYYHHGQAGPIKSEEDGGGGGGGGQIGLNLGHRTYFSSADAVPIDRLFKRSTRGVLQQAPRCQAEGCKADLSGAKHYHRRHKVCEFHSKATVVVATGGLQQRFCQQCSRFHVLSEFDEAKRSCRKRLADHNRRRRKPQLPATTTTATTTDPSAAASQQEPAEKSNQTTSKPTRDISTTKGTTNSTVSTIPLSISNQTSISLENPEGCQKKATHLRNGPALSLGGAGGEDNGGFGSHPSLYHHQRPLMVVMSADENSAQQQQKQQHISSSSSSWNTFFHPHSSFCSSSDEASQLTLTGGGRSDVQTNHHHSSFSHHGQGMFEVHFT